MKSTYRIFLRKHWDAVLASITACVFIYFFSRHGGIGISPDSVSYLSAANNISNHFSFTDFNGLPLVDFPRGYPFFLAALAWISGTPVFQIMPVVNALLFSSAIFLTSIIIAGFRNVTPVYKALILSILAFSPALLEVYSMLWSETLFLVLCLLFFVVSRKYLAAHSPGGLLWMSLVAALAFVTRYAGICLIITGGALIFFDGWLSVRKKIIHLLLFCIIGSSLAALNIFLNHRASASLTGVREKATRSVADNIGQVSDVISGWLPFLHDHSIAAVLTFSILFFIAAIYFCFSIVQQQYYPSYETIVNGFFVVYLIFIVTVASLSRFEDLSNRLLSPSYIPMLLVASWWMPRLARKISLPARYIMVAVCLLLYAGLVYRQYCSNAEAWEGIRDAGIPGYTENSWKTSPTVKYIQQHKDSLLPVMYSDANDAVYFLAGLHARALPHKEIRQEIDSLLAQPAFSVIWFDDGFNADLVDIDLIKQHKKLVSVKSFTGGAIYQFLDSVPISKY